MRLARACGGTPNDAAACATVDASAEEDEVEAAKADVEASLDLSGPNTTLYSVSLIPILDDLVCVAAVGLLFVSLLSRVCFEDRVSLGISALVKLLGCCLVILGNEVGWGPRTGKESKVKM